MMDRSDLTELLTALVAIPSVNPLGRSDRPPASPPVVDCVERWLSRHGIACAREPLASGEVNLIAQVNARGGGPTIVFDAHTDTVPASDWADRAFSPRIEAGRLYGRGTCDTKGSLAAMMVALAAAAQNGEQLPHSVVLLASADEEYGRTGVRAFLDSVGPASSRSPIHRLEARATTEARPTIDYAVVGEPTCCRPVIACKGAARCDMVVPGKSAHTSTPRRGINAIARMASLVRVLEEYERTVLARKTHPLVDAATVTPAMVRGGTATNVVPDSCRVSVDLRTMPDEDPAVALQDLQAFVAGQLDFPVQYEGVQLWEGADISPDHPFVGHCIACCRSAESGAKTDSRTGQISPLGVNYGCHASDYASRGIPAIVIGPGDIAVAHMVDEFIELDSLWQAARIYLKIMTTPLPAS